MTDRHGHIGTGNNAPREFKGRRAGQEPEEWLDILRGELLLKDEVAWKKLRRNLWSGDRYRMRHFRKQLVSSGMIHIRVGLLRAEFIGEGPNLWCISSSELRTPVSPSIVKSKKWTGRFQVDCRGCGTLVDRPFDSEALAKTWFWETHVLEAVGHR
jgi:hypothetical protein